MANTEILIMMLPVTVMCIAFAAVVVIRAIIGDDK